MRVLAGKKVTDAPPDWRSHIESQARPVVIDLGAGDGRYVYDSARNDPTAFYIAVDPDPQTLADYAYRASRKPARGGVENAAFVVAAVEALPAELRGLAGRVRINFPWGSLLRGLLEPRPAVVAAVATLLRPGGLIEVVMSYDPAHDTNAFSGEPLPLLDNAYLEDALLPALAHLGFAVVLHRRMTRDEALNLTSTWGRRLLHARPREVYFIAIVPAPRQ